jgi:hypothetical protein
MLNAERVCMVQGDDLHVHVPGDPDLKLSFRARDSPFFTSQRVVVPSILLYNALLPSEDVESETRPSG